MREEAGMGPLSGLLHLIDFISTGLQALLALSPIPL
jgi:hypothetical protein